MYFLLKMGIFQPAMLVYQRVDSNCLFGVGYQHIIVLEKKGENSKVLLSVILGDLRFEDQPVYCLEAGKRSPGKYPPNYLMRPETVPFHRSIRS